MHWDHHQKAYRILNAARESAFQHTFCIPTPIYNLTCMFKELHVYNRRAYIKAHWGTKDQWLPCQSSCFIAPLMAHNTWVRVSHTQLLLSHFYSCGSTHVDGLGCIKGRLQCMMFPSPCTGKWWESIIHSCHHGGRNSGSQRSDFFYPPSDDLNLRQWQGILYHLQGGSTVISKLHTHLNKDALKSQPLW